METCPVNLYDSVCQHVAGIFEVMLQWMHLLVLEHLLCSPYLSTYKFHTSGLLMKALKGNWFYRIIWEMYSDLGDIMGW